MVSSSPDFHHRIFSIALSVLTVLACLPARAIQVDPQLLKQLKADSESGTREVVINLKGKADFSDLQVAEGQSRPQAVAKALKAFNEKAAKKLIEFLHSSDANDVQEIQPIWITNSLRVKAS